MKTMTSFIVHNPLPAYIIQAYAFAWIFAPLIAISPVYGLPGLYALGLAGIIVSRVNGGQTQASLLLRKLAIWRVNLVWYLVALGMPFVLSFLVAALARFFGADPVLQPSPVTSLEMIVFVLVVDEELGWRG